MKITIVAVGKIKEKFYKDAFSEYSKRLSRYCKLEVIEVPDEKEPENPSDNMLQIIQHKEAERILKQIKQDAYLISLEINGEKFDSIKMANKIENMQVVGKSHLLFIIGGSNGLHSIISNKVDEKWSFSDLTFPHQLMRVILAEQIYRSFRIINKEPYHK